MIPAILSVVACVAAIVAIVLVFVLQPATGTQLTAGTGVTIENGVISAPTLTAGTGITIENGVIAADPATNNNSGSSASTAHYRFTNQADPTNLFPNANLAAIRSIVFENSFVGPSTADSDGVNLDISLALSDNFAIGQQLTIENHSDSTIAFFIGAVEFDNNTYYKIKFNASTLVDGEVTPSYMTLSMSPGNVWEYEDFHGTVFSISTPP